MTVNLEKSILSTLAYFDIFEHPLTLVEIKKNLFVSENSTLPREISLEKISEILQGKSLKNKVNQKNGYYFLKNKEEYKTRQDRYYIADEKYKRARKVVWLLKKIPYIKMIAICNSLSYSNASAGSDIDLFVVTAKNRIWRTRLISVLLMKALHLRPTKQNSKNKICLSFFIDENNLNLKKFQINQKHADIYLIYWISQLFPIYDQDDNYNMLWEQNSWIKKYLPFAQRQITNSRRETKVVQKIDSFPASYDYNFVESIAKKIQLKFLNQKLKEMMNKDSRVVINDGVLKLYSTDKREQYHTQWLDNLSKMV